MKLFRRIKEQYHKSALQVNSYEYARKYRGAGQDHGLSEEEYNDRLINKCIEEEISVIAVTDHNFVENINPIREKATDEDIVVLPGFEICSKENVDVLCLFSPETEVETLNRYLGGLGISDTEHSSSNSDKTFTEILRKVQCEWEGVCIAAHITNNNGLLKTLESEARINAWKSENLLAAQISWTVDDLDFKYRQVVKHLSGFVKSYF